MQTRSALDTPADCPATIRAAAGYKALLSLVFAAIAVGVLVLAATSQEPGALLFALGPAVVAAMMAIGSVVQTWRCVR